MKNSLLLYCFIFLFSVTLTAQSEINKYKYIVVPDQFDFVNEKDKYQLNSLTKFLFNKYGYTAFLESDDLPSDYNNNRCLGLEAEAKKIKKGFLDTRIQIDLINCDNEVVHSSKVGVTRLKEYAKAYNVALRDAFETYKNFAYSYTPDQSIVSRASKTSNTDENAQTRIDELEKEIEALKKESDNTQEQQKESSTNEEAELAVEESKEVAEQVVEDVKLKAEKETIAVAPELTTRNWYDGLPKYSRKGEYYYLKPEFGGMYLMDASNKQVLKLQYTSDSSVFIVKIAKNTGVAFMKSKEIKVEYYKENGDKVERYYDLVQ